MQESRRRILVLAATSSRVWHPSTSSIGHHLSIYLSIHVNAGCVLMSNATIYHHCAFSPWPSFTNISIHQFILSRLHRHHPRRSAGFHSRPRHCPRLKEREREIERQRMKTTGINSNESAAA